MATAKFSFVHGPADPQQSGKARPQDRPRLVRKRGAELPAQAQ